MTKNIRDTVLYVLIGVALAVAAVAIGIYDSDHHLRSDNQVMGIAAVGFTAFVFGYLVKTYFELLRSPKAWGLLLILLLLHGAAVVWLIRVAIAKESMGVPLPLFAALSLVEIAGFGYILEKLLKPKNG